MALLASICSVAGALVGLAIPTSAAQISLGITILFVVALMLKTGGPASTTESQPTALSEALRLYGVTYDPETDCRVGWKACNTLTGLVLFSGIGFLAGMFGMGAGWANVPTLNIVMGIPLRVSAGTSSFILSLVDSAAAWVYLQKGAVLAAVIVPSMCGMMLGARIGVETLRVLKASAIRKLVISLLLLAGVRALMKGVGL